MSRYTVIPRGIYQTWKTSEGVRPGHANSRARIQKQTIVIYTAGTLGDHWPFMALGQALTARGYRVRMAVNPAIHTLVQRAGLEAVALPEPRMGPEQVRQHAQAWDHWAETGDPEASEALATLFRAYGVEAPALLRALLSLCQDADLLLATSIRPWGWVVHRALGVPWLTISVVLAQFGTPPGNHSSRTHDWEAAQRLLHYHVQDWLRQVLLRLAPTLTPTCAHGPLWSDEVLLASSPHFSPASGTVSPAHAVTVHSSGFWFYDDPAWCNWEPARALWRFVERRPLVLSFSSLPVVNPSAVLTVHVQAAAMLGRPLLVQAGWAGFSAALLPSHLRTADVSLVFSPMIGSLRRPPAPFNMAGLAPSPALCGRDVRSCLSPMATINSSTPCRCSSSRWERPCIRVS